MRLHTRAFAVLSPTLLLSMDMAMASERGSSWLLFGGWQVDLEDGEQREIVDRF